MGKGGGETVLPNAEQVGLPRWLVASTMSWNVEVALEAADEGRELETSNESEARFALDAIWRSVMESEVEPTLFISESSPSALTVEVSASNSPDTWMESVTAVCLEELCWDRSSSDVDIDSGETQIEDKGRSI